MLVVVAVRIVSEVIFVVSQTCAHAQQAIESELGEGDVLVHGVQVVGVDGSHEVAQQPHTLGVWEGLPLVLHHFLSLVIVVVHLCTKRSNLFDGLHPLAFRVHVGARDES